MEFKNYGNRVLEEIRESLLTVDDSDMAGFLECIMQTQRIFCDGSGRSGLKAKAFAMRLAQMGKTAYDTAGVTTPAIKKEDMLLICSGSGETPVLIGHAEKARELGASIALITTNSDSTIGKMSDYCFVLRAESKMEEERHTIQPMGTLFEQSLAIFLDVIVLMLMEKSGIDNDAMYKEHNNLE